jgi:hypothetical protein
MRASHLTSYFDEGFFGFIFWRRFHWLRILMKASYFGFIFWRRLLTLTLYFDEGLAIFSFFSLKNEGFTPSFVFWWMFHFSMKNEGFTPDSVFWWTFHFFSEKWRLHTLASYFDGDIANIFLFFSFFTERRFDTPLRSLEPVIVVLTKLTITAQS